MLFVIKIRFLLPITVTVIDGNGISSNQRDLFQTIDKDARMVPYPTTIDLLCVTL